MNDLESRLFQLELLVSTRLQYDLQQLKQAVQALQNDQRVNASGWMNGGAGGGIGYYACTLSAALAHGGNVTAQTVWKLSGGSRVNVSTNATIYNDGPTSTNDIPSGKTIIVGLNDDGTFTAKQVYC